MSVAKYVLCLSCCLYFSMCKVSAQKLTIDSVVTRFLDYHQKVPQEKVYLSTNKEVFTFGETLWFSAFLTDAVTHTPSILSTVLYIDLISPKDEVISTLNIKIEDGRGNGDFELADSLTQGVYRLRAYTQYMKNFDESLMFTRPVKLLDFSSGTETPEVKQSPKDIDIQFFPEGGNLVAGQINYVAFKAVNEKGVGIPISGKIVDDKGVEVTSYEEVVHGMGKFQITPEKGRKYFASYTINSVPFSKQLPEVRGSGYLINIRQTHDKIYLTVKPSEGMDLSGSFVVGHNRGLVFTVLQPQSGQNFIYAPLPASQIPSGILHFTFFDGKIRPMAERLVFNYNELLNPNITLNSEDPVFEQRQKADFDLDLTDVNGEPLDGDFSVSVLSAFRDDPNKVNIENYLLLGSDLTGSIEDPEWYFNEANEHQLLHRDLVMMINGWRRFQWEDVLEKRYPPVEYFPEKGFSIEGRVVKYLKRDEGVRGKVELSFLNNLLFHQEAVTGEDGTFWFDGLQIEDTMTSVIKTVRLKEKDDGSIKETKRGSYIIIREKAPPDRQFQFIKLFRKDEAYQDLADNNLKIRNIEAEFGNDIVILDEVEVEAKKDRREDPFYRESALYRRPNHRVVLDSLSWSNSYTNLFDFMRGKLPGVQITGTYPNQTALIRGGSGSITLENDALFLVDGIPTDRTIVNNIPVQQVEFIDVLSGAQASLYSAQGRGIIAIYTRSGPALIDRPDPIGFTSFIHNGFYPPREFYVPQYDIMSAEEKVKPDYRSTLFWDPRVELRNGEASFDFYTSDERGEFIIYMEGLTSSGLIINRSTSFTVE